MDTPLYDRKGSCYIEDSGRNIGFLLALLAFLFFIVEMALLFDGGPFDLFTLFGFIFWSVPPGLLLWGGIHLIRNGDLRYEWDAEALRRRVLFKPVVTIPWSSITELTLNYNDDQPVYCLHQESGEMLRLNFGMIPDDHGLEDWIQRKLEPLYLKAIGASEFALPFTSFSSGVGCAPGEMTLEEHRLVQTKGYEDFSVAYDEIKIVLIESVPIRSDAKRRRTRYTLSDGVNDRLAFDSCYCHVPRIIYFLRQRLKSALWVDLTQSTPPQEPCTAAIYHQHRIANGIKAGKDLAKVATLFLFIWLVFATISFYHNGSTQPDMDLVINLIFIIIFNLGLFGGRIRDIRLGQLSHRALHRPDSK